MKIVQSFWSKPMTHGTNWLVNAGGWYNKRLFLYGSVLSALLLRKHYPGKTVFVTDQFGNDLFIEKIGLNFSEVIVELDDLNEFSHTLWALGKIYAYSRIGKHFIHFDQDFFLPAPLQGNILTAPLVAYTSESSQMKQDNIYIPHINSFINVLPQLNDRIKDFCLTQPKIAYNAGILGGFNTEVFKELWALCFGIVTDNLQIINSHDCHFFNVVMEQFFFSCIAREKQIPVTCLEQEDLVVNVAKYTSMKFFPTASSIHVMANGKCSASSCICIEEILFTDYPEYFHRINSLLNRNLI